MADPATSGYKVSPEFERVKEGCGLMSVGQFNHTMIRIKDPKASIKFYTEVSTSVWYLLFGLLTIFVQALGMDLIEGQS